MQVRVISKFCLAHSFEHVFGRMRKDIASDVDKSLCLFHKICLGDYKLNNKGLGSFGFVLLWSEESPKTSELKWIEFLKSERQSVIFQV